MRVLLTVLVTAVVLFPLTANAIDVWGDQSGIWTKDNSPYNVIGEIRVPPGETLTIEPGVVVNFMGHHKFIVDNSATLLAVGTESDSIYFTTDYPYTGWHGIRFLSANNNCQLSYCRIEYGKAQGSGFDDRGGGIYCENSSLTITYNTIHNNTASWAGGGIFCSDNPNTVIAHNTIANNSARYSAGGEFAGNRLSIIANLITGNYADVNGGGFAVRYASTVTITDNMILGNTAAGYDAGGLGFGSGQFFVSRNIISGNSAGRDGGGIWCGTSDSTTIISDNTITDNSAGRSGGGIYCENISPTIENNTIDDNSAGNGGGICCNYSSPAIRGNTISNNLASDGGGILCDYSSPAISGNIISGNSAIFGSSRKGGGILCSSNSNPPISNNTISNNSASDYGGGIYCHSSSPTVTNAILWGNTAPNGPEIHVAGSNPLVTYCDVQGGWAGQGNINSDPLFVDPGAGDFHLQWGSPCIDAGDPNSAPDPDSTRADIGAFYFHQGLLFSPEAYAFNLELDSSADKPLSLENIGADTAHFQLSADVDWISFSPESGYVAPDTTFYVLVTFDGTDLPLGPNEATISLEAMMPYGQLEYELPVAATVYSLEYTYVSLEPDTLPIVIPPEGGSFHYWAGVHNSSSILYRFDIWIDATLPDGSTYGPMHIRENFRFRPWYSQSRHLRQNVPGAAPQGEYSYNFKMGVFPDQVDYQDSFSFTKLDAGLLPNLARVTSWDLYGWDEELVTYLGQGHDAKTLGPTEYSLSQNYPNPFNATTTIKYQLPVEGDVKLEVYNLFGQEVATLVDSKQQAGYRSVNWDASSVSSGLYFYRLTVGDYTETRRMLLVK